MWHARLLCGTSIYIVCLKLHINIRPRVEKKIAIKSRNSRLAGNERMTYVYIFTQAIGIMFTKVYCIYIHVFQEAVKVAI